jgi:hypothetical protein
MALGCGALWTGSALEKRSFSRVILPWHYSLYKIKKCEIRGDHQWLTFNSKFHKNQSNERKEEMGKHTSREHVDIIGLLRFLKC